MFVFISHPIKKEIGPKNPYIKATKSSIPNIKSSSFVHQYTNDDTPMTYHNMQIIISAIEVKFSGIDFDNQTLYKNL